MSTHAPTTPETHRPTDQSSPAALLTGDRSTDDAWVARCQRQFDHRRTERLRNLADDRNAATPDPAESMET